MAYTITTANASLEFDTTQGTWDSSYKIDTNHFINFYSGSGGDGYVTVLAVNTTTWAVTTTMDFLEFNTTNGTYHNCEKVDDNHFIDFFSGTTAYGEAQIFTVNTTTWVASTTIDPFVFSGTTATSYHSIGRIGDNHYINFFRMGTAMAQTFEVNTTTYAITTSSDTLNFATAAGMGVYNSCGPIDENHFVNFFEDLNFDGYAQVFEVNTTTWAVTTAGDIFSFNSSNTHNACFKIDTNHFLNISVNLGETNAYAQAFTVNTTTWAVTTAGGVLDLGVTNGSWASCQKIGDNNFITFISGVDGDGFAEVLTVSTSTWEVTTSATQLEFDTVSGTYHSSQTLDTTHFLNIFAGNSSDGYAQVFLVEASAGGWTTGSFNGVASANISTVDSAPIATISTINSV